MQAVGVRLGRAEVWRGLTDLATLGTVADIVPLSAENRALVASGVALMRNETRVSIAALAAVGGNLAGIRSVPIASPSRSLRASMPPDAWRTRSSHSICS